MAIGTAAAIIGSAAISAGVGAISSSKASKAANKATQAQVDSNAQSLALQRDIYDRNSGVLNPYVQQGYAANNALAGFLGLNGQPAQTGAFDTFRDSTGYQFRVNEGMKALNTGFAGRGILNSGAAAKAAIQFGQDQGTGALGQYLSLLTGQQQVGLGAGSALAGVGTTFANNATNINSDTASAIGNGALAKASISNGFLDSIGRATGQVAGALSSYGQMPSGIAAGGGGGYYGGFNGNAFASQYGVKVPSI